MTGWTAIVPVKRWTHGKSRLAVDEAERVALARAFSLDVLDVVTRAPAVGRVVVVTAEPELALIARQVGATVLDDSDTLNHAIGEARRWAERAAPDARLVVVPADLPALSGAVFDEVLHLLSATDRTFIPDHSGDGTTLLATARPDLMETIYGHDSARQHAAAGYRSLAEVDPRARLDVDTADDLAEARRWGVGSHTSSVLADVMRTPILRP